jgi:hypothetical protein
MQKPQHNNSNLPTSQRGLSAHLYALMEHSVGAGLTYEVAVLSARRRWMAAKRYEEAITEREARNDAD